MRLLYPAVPVLTVLVVLVVVVLAAVVPVVVVVGQKSHFISFDTTTGMRNCVHG